MLVKPCIIYQERISESGSSPAVLCKSPYWQQGKLYATIQDQILNVQCPVSSSEKPKLPNIKTIYSPNPDTQTSAGEDLCTFVSVSPPTSAPFVDPSQHASYPCQPYPLVFCTRGILPRGESPLAEMVSLQKERGILLFCGHSARSARCGCWQCVGEFLLSRGTCKCIFGRSAYTYLPMVL